MAYKVRLSISPEPLPGKIQGGDLESWANLYRSLTHVEMTIVEVADAIYKGHVIGPLLRGWRSYDHFIGGQIIGVDMDSGNKHSAMSTLIDHDMMQMYGGVIHSTYNSRPTAPRSRVLHFLDELITDPYEFKKAIKTVSAYYNGYDLASAEPTRTFFGNGTLAQTHNIDGIYIQEGVLPVADVWMMHKAQLAAVEAKAMPKPDYTQHDLNLTRLVNACIGKAKEGHRNSLGYWLACRLVENGVPTHEQEDAMRMYAMGVPQSSSPYTEEEAMLSLRSARTGA